MFSKYILGSIGVISSVIGTVVQSVEIAHVENKKLIVPNYLFFFFPKIATTLGDILFIELMVHLSHV